MAMPPYYLDKYILITQLLKLWDATCPRQLSLPPTHLENTSTTTELSSGSLIQDGEFDSAGRKRTIKVGA
ncbi:hypothetical protein EYZ11_010300 [Aspergillus tanneri]|uniref:Uncharacterized protein n=1 Tax=Aspergillus tanneri TaxID=1220188 RepID=A0A4S3J5Q7_9EURO|nr:hypothetical protein EYZ11_010300 [Aspergillus tanneri]